MQDQFRNKVSEKMDETTASRRQSALNETR